MFKRRCYLGLLLMMLMMVPVVSVSAATYESTSSCYYFNRTTGAISTASSNPGTSATYGRDCIKKIDGKYAYCTQLSTQITNTNYTEDTAWNAESNKKNSIIMGYIIDLVRQDKGDTLEGYALTAEAINYYNRNVLGNTSAYGFSTNSTLKGYYDRAVAKYNELKLDEKIPSPSLSGDRNLNYVSGNKYVSSKLTATNLQATFGGVAVDYTITVSMTGGNGTVQLSTKATGENPTDTLAVSGRSSYSFYVVANGVNTTNNSDLDIVVKIARRNTSTYPMTKRYKSNSASQNLVVGVSDSASRYNHTKFSFSVPDLTQHRIVVNKVNEDGEALSGATLELHKDSATSAAIATNSSGSSRLVYSTPRVETGEDDFFNHTYYLVEKVAPRGYKLSSRVTEINISNANSSICYHNGGNDDEDSQVEPDAEHCNFSAYEYRCKNDTTNEIVALSSQNNCTFEAPAGTDTGGSGTDTGGSGTDTGGSGTDTGGSGTDTGGDPTPVTYTMICVKKGANDTVTEANTTYCADAGNYTLVKVSNGSVTIEHPNVRNKAVISKKAITGDDEVPGAVLKICTKTDYEAKKSDCTPAKSVDDVDLSWTSGTGPEVVFGLAAGEYHIVETLPPSGYALIKTSTSFSIDTYGNITTGGKTIEEDKVDDNPIVIKNTLNSFSVSKDDVATSKELPGATITICETYTDANNKVQVRMDQYTNECIVTRLAGGSDAQWVSGDKPHVINGLKAGTYALVEKIAPSGYATAESIIFTMKNDGTLTDKDGKSLADSKLVMHDKKLTEVKTGMLTTFIVALIIFVVSIIGVYSYFFIKKHSEVSS